MDQKTFSNLKVQKPIDEASLINNIKSQTKPIPLINPFLVKEFPKERKDLFILTKNLLKVDPKEKEKDKDKTPKKRQIDLSPNKTPLSLPISLPNKQEHQEKQEKPENEKQKEPKENSDFDIDIMTESLGLNGKDKEFGIDSLKINLEKNEEKEDDEDEDSIEEINIANDDSESKDEELSLSNNSIIDITEERNSEISKEEEKNDDRDKEYSINESIKKLNQKRRFLRGHCPFNFFEKEMCKNMNFKKINLRMYISEISAKWKTMTDKEKEPYVKLSEEFKNNYIANNGFDEFEEHKITSKKRRRRKRNIINNTNNNNSTNQLINPNMAEGTKIINNNINFNNNKIDNFSVYTTNKYVKKKMNPINSLIPNLNEKSFNENKSFENETSSYIQQTLEKSENDKKENNFISELSDKFKILKNISESQMNEYIKSVLIPFVVKSFEFLNNIRNENSKERS